MSSGDDRGGPVRVLLVLLICFVIAAVGLATVLSFRVRPKAMTAPAPVAVTTEPVAVITPPPATAPAVQIAVGKVRPPLAYRIISFQNGKGDKALVKRAAELGFNGVQIQLEGSTLRGIQGFALWDAQNGFVDYCHSLNMKVTVWVHEFSDLPAIWMPEYLGPVKLDNQRLWQTLDARYEWILSKALPKVDGLALTVVETEVRATSTPVMVRLVNLVHAKCRKYGKELIVRTFVWYPKELAGVMGAVEQFPRDVVVMTKNVPQDWQMRGAYAAEIGRAGGRTQVIEYDAFGEYFLHEHVANCMPALEKRHFDYDVAKGVQGICVRVDRDGVNVLWQPSEINLWALGMLAAGATDNVDDVWDQFTTYRYGKSAAAGVTKALKPTEEVVSELLSIGPFSFADTRRFPPPVGNEPLFTQNWQNWWWDKRYLPAYRMAERGDSRFVADVRTAKANAMVLADQCLRDLDDVKDRLSAEDYAILRTKLLSNKVALAVRAPMALADLSYRAISHAATRAKKRELARAVEGDVAAVRQAAPPWDAFPQHVWFANRWWDVGVAEAVDREGIFKWAYDMDTLLKKRGFVVRAPAAAAAGR